MQAGAPADGGEVLGLHQGARLHLSSRVQLNTCAGLRALRAAAGEGAHHLYAPAVRLPDAPQQADHLAAGQVCVQVHEQHRLHLQTPGSSACSVSNVQLGDPENFVGGSTSGQHTSEWTCTWKGCA